MATPHELALELVNQFPEIEEPTRSALIDAIAELIAEDRRHINARIQFLLGNYSNLTVLRLNEIRQQIEKALYDGQN